MRQEKRWTQEEEQFLRDNYETMSYIDIGNQVGRSDSAIRAKCFDLGLVKHNRWSQDELNFVSKNISTMSYKEMAQYLNRTESAVQLAARKKLHLKKTPYYCDYHYFETVDSEEKAYWLGFIYADGYITINHKTNSGVVGIDLQNRDIKHLQKFNKSIAGNYKITTRDRCCQLGKDPTKTFPMSSIRVYSRKMADDLIKLGICERKSHDLHFPSLPQPLMSAFVRGYFDGDGCITSHKIKGHTYIRCFMDSIQLSFLIALREHLYQQNICSYIGETDTTYRLTIHSDLYSQLFLNYIYKDAAIYLDRKYQKYIKISTMNPLWASSRRNERIQEKSGEEIGKAETPIRMEGCG